MATQNTDAFHVVADPGRRHILQLLTKDGYNINSLAVNFDIRRPAVSKHIKILRMAGFISIREISRERHCVLSERGFVEIRNWLDHFDDFWNSKLKNLATILKRKMNSN